MAQSPEKMWQAMVDNMPEKTGKALPEWFKLLKASGLTKHGELMKLLKGEHSLTHGYANSIAMMFRQELEGGAPTEKDLVSAQYAGDKAALRPIYDSLIKGIQQFGEDVEISPKKTYVSLRRAKQFGLIQPSTKTRVDVGINSKTLKAYGALEDSGSFNSMCSHRVRLSSPADVNDQLLQWLEAAYEEAG